MTAVWISEPLPMSQPLVAHDDETELIRRAQQRDVDAFEQLYRRHVSRVYAVCIRLTANARRADELTQTAFIQIWQKLPLFRGESAFSSWLHRLAVNTVLSDFRSTRRRETRVINVADLSPIETPASSASAGARLDLEQVIATLPQQARTIFVLHDVEGYTHEEIAELMQLQSGTTKAQLHRARQLLQEALR
jgi:RNA polymerase sigma-70 factor (ECF subfamily)